MDKEIALKILRELHDKALFSERTALETFIPELKESEDERIRKALITYFSDEDESYDGIPYPNILAWLEAQAGQKPAWSEDDEKCFENAIMYCEWARDKAPDLHCYETSKKSINWLKSLRPQNRWKPSDEQMEALWEAYRGGEEQAALASLYSDLKKLKRE